jgi:hypothetical protein
MRKNSILFLAASAYSLISCHSNEAKKKQFPRPGTIVAEASMPVSDPLNHFVFSVAVVADSDILKGVYDVDAAYGPNFAEGKFTMPAGIEDLKPVIRKGNTPYTYVIGFRQPGDTTFYEYFEVTSNKKTTQMRYLKAYTF